jgi:predicted AlkP superfamily phosphohydrolase/phosphomutase
MSKGRVVVIGLDAFDPQLAASWAEQGELPTLARLFAQGTRAVVHNPFGLFVGSLWFNFASALKPHRHRYHCWDEIDPSTYQWRRVSPEPGGYSSFWTKIGEAGRRVAAVDVPHSKAPASLNGIEVAEWGCHDRHFGFHAIPAGKAGELAAAHGLHPILGVDAYQVRDFAPDDFVHRRGQYRTAEEDKALLDGLKAGTRTKGEMLGSLLAEEPWDLFVGVFGESHAVGHQLYHLHDPGHPQFDRARQAALGGDPVLQI